jgi:hypothetical protein
MKITVILIMLAALFLLYRIAYPKQEDMKRDRDAPPEKPKTVPDVMGKSRFVLPDRSQPLQTPATKPETGKEAEKALIFAAGTGEKPSAIIPADELDRVFGNDSGNEIMSIPLEYENEGETDYEAEEETEELGRVLGHEPEYADGIDYDSLQTAAKAVREQPDEVSEETAVTLEKLGHTDMFEWLVSGDEGKLNWIKAVIERNIPKTAPEMEETEGETSDADYGDFEIADFLS